MRATRPLNPDALDAVFDALAHPARRQMIAVLYARGGVMTAGAIADRFKHAWPTTTRHLRVLEAAGLVRSIRRGRQRDYGLDSGPAVGPAAGIQAWTATPPVATSAERAKWADLPYATMHDAVAPTPNAAASRTNTKPRQDRTHRRAPAK